MHFIVRVRLRNYFLVFLKSLEETPQIKLTNKKLHNNTWNVPLGLSKKWITIKQLTAKMAQIHSIFNNIRLFTMLVYVIYQTF